MMLHTIAVLAPSTTSTSRSGNFCLETYTDHLLEKRKRARLERENSKLLEQMNDQQTEEEIRRISRMSLFFPVSSCHDLIYYRYYYVYWPVLFCLTPACSAWLAIISKYIIINALILRTNNSILLSISTHGRWWFASCSCYCYSIYYIPLLHSCWCTCQTSRCHVVWHGP